MCHDSISARSFIAATVVNLFASTLIGDLRAEEHKWGTLCGRIVYSKERPKRKPIAIRKQWEPDGAGRWHIPADPFYHDKEIYDESLLIADDGGLANVVVFLQPERRETIPIHPDQIRSAHERVRLTIEDGSFKPHILAMRTDQVLEIVNRDPVALHVKILTYENRSSSRLLKEADRYEFSLDKQEPLPMPVRSQIHYWMKAYVFPRENPYYAVTDKSGRFEITDIPVGKRTFRLWHERPGKIAEDLDRGRFEIRIKPGLNEIGTIRATMD